MKVKVDAYTSVYYDTEDRKFYVIVEYEDIDGKGKQSIVCSSI